MPRQESSRYKLSHGWVRGEDWWGDPVSTNFLMIDALLHPYVLSMTETIPPINGVAVGDMYLVPSGAVLAWSGHENTLAVYDGSKWVFAAPTRGVRARLANPSGWIWWNGTAWVNESQGEGQPPAPQGTRYDVAVSVGFEAEPDDVLLAFSIPEAMTLPDTAVGSSGRSLVAPLGIMRLIVKRNGAEVGTIVFAPNSVRAQFTVVGNKDFAAGDLLTVHVPESPPSGFENYAVTIRLLLKQTGG